MRSESSWSLARRILALQAIVLVVVLGGLLTAVVIDTNAETERATGERVAVTSQASAQELVRSVAATLDQVRGN